MKKAIEQRTLDFLTGPHRETDSPRARPILYEPPAASQAHPPAETEAPKLPAAEAREARISACIASGRHVRGAMGDCVSCCLPMLEPRDRRCPKCFAWVLALAPDGACASCSAPEAGSGRV